MLLITAYTHKALQKTVTQFVVLATSAGISVIINASTVRLPPLPAAALLMPINQLRPKETDTTMNNPR